MNKWPWLYQFLKSKVNADPTRIILDYVFNDEQVEYYAKNRNLNIKFKVNEEASVRFDNLRSIIKYFLNKPLIKFRTLFKLLNIVHIEQRWNNKEFDRDYMRIRLADLGERYNLEINIL